MRKVLSVVVVISWALWLGGLGALMLAVMSLFKALDRTAAGQSATVIFQRFERYQLVLASVLLVSLILWMLARGAMSKAILIILTLLASILAAALPSAISPRIEVLRQTGQTQSDEFKRLHKMGERMYGGAAILMLAGGLFIPSAVRSDARPRKTSA